MNWNWVLLLSGAGLILVEIALGGFAGFDLVLIGSAFVLGGALGLAFGNTTLGFLVASALCIVYIAVGRRWVRKRLHNRTVPSNADALIGQSGMVVVKVGAHEPGQVKVRDEIWRAVPASGNGPFEAGAIVTVAAIDGVTLEVK
jgi:membrane protein implicated in regulation of membrane protease activity